MRLLLALPLAVASLACSGAPDSGADDATEEAPLTASEQQAQRALETRLANSSWAGDGQSPALGLSVKRNASTLEYKLHRYACFGPDATECEHAVDHGNLRTEWRTASGKRSLFIVLQPWSTSVKGKDGPGPTQVYLPALYESGRLELTPYFGTCAALGDTGCTTQGGRSVWAYFVVNALDVSKTAFCAGDYWVANPRTYAGDPDCDWAGSVAGPGATSIIGGSCPWVCSETLTSSRAGVDTLGRCVQRCR